MAGTVLVVDDSPTIRKVVIGVLEARGFVTLSAGDGKEALEVLRESSVDMVLLDFVMPVMNGYQFCRELRADPKLGHLPVVLMSAKGDKIRGQFVQQTGAVDAITKPFDPRALVAVVETTLRKPAKDSRKPGVSDDPALDLKRVEALKDPEERATEVAGLFARGLAALVLPVVKKLGGAGDQAQLAEAMRAALEPSRLRGLGGLLALLDKRRSESAVLAGDLGFISIAEVLQMLELQRQTGAIHIAYGDQEIVLYLVNGRIDFARSSNLPMSFRIGRFLVEDGVVTREQLEPVIDGSRPERRLIGEELERRGAARPEQVRAALKRQSSELVYEAVRWRSGRFNFDVGDTCPEAEMAQLSLTPGGLLMEGFRRVDEWQLIEGSFKFDDVLVVDPAAVERLSERSELEPIEELVLATIDGKRKVRQIVDDVDASTFDVCKAIYQFINAGAVRRKSV
jgi:CheY-like chemotaxis protein